jgi:hypothetical protein
MWMDDLRKVEEVMQKREEDMRKKGGMYAEGGRKVCGRREEEMLKEGGSMRN